MIRGRFGADWDWLLVMALLTSVELIWWFIVWRLGVAPAPFTGTYLVLAAGGLALALVLRLALRLGPIAAPWPSIAAGTLLVAIGASVFLPLKYAIPHQIPFWLDRPLAAAERALFGSHPWQLLNRLLGWATTPVDWTYGCWLPTQLLVMFLVMLSRPSQAKSRALIAYSLAWFLLGAIGAVLLSSAGPLFYDRAFGGSEFEPLTETLRSRGAWFALTESDRMWASVSADEPGLIAGISAMPSIHVAASAWLALALTSFWRKLSVVGWGYWLIIFVGSFALGWHYFLDSAVGTIGALACWAVAPKLLWRHQSRLGRRVTAIPG